METYFKKKKKTKTIAWYKKKTWNAFSLFIRLRDSDKDGFCTCISCGKRLHWKQQAQAGHFIPAGAGNRLYFDEVNVNVQCYRCNCILSGNLYEYSIRIDIKYGKGTALKLKEIKDKREIVKFSIEQLKEMRQKYIIRAENIEL